MNQWQFANPEFLLLAGLPLLYGVLRLISGGNTKQHWHSKAIEIFQLQRFSWRIWIHRLKPIALSLSFILLVITFARPQTPQEPHKIYAKGIDIVIALDVSGSMLSEDFSPNRLEVAKLYIREFVRNRASDRISIVIFAGKPFTQAPLTFDYGVIDQYLAEISTDSIDQLVQGLRGTAVGDAYLAGIGRFDAKDTKREKVMILFTDGASTHGIDPLQVAPKAQKEGVKTYTVGIGNRTPAPLQSRNASGKLVPIKDFKGRPLMSSFDEKTLQAIAKTTDGTYFYAKEENDLKEILEAIEKLEPQEYVSEVVAQSKDQFLPWLIGSFLSFLFFLCLEFLIPLRQ